MRIVFLFFLILSTANAQGWLEQTEVEATVFKGNVYKHTDYVRHLITEHPQGLLISVNQKTKGEKEWERAYNYPDYGFNFFYQDYKNPVLDAVYSIGAHYNFYFLNRQLQFRISQGVGYATNPYHKTDNPKNNALGSHWLSSNIFSLNYKKERLFGNWGAQAGFIFTHFSNGRMKSPNSGINTYAIQAGLNYQFDKEPISYIQNDSTAAKSFAEPLRFTAYFRTGVTESLVVGSGQKPFYHIGLGVDKRLGRKSALQLGADVFLSTYLKEYIRYMSVAYPDRPYLDPETDYRRIGVFVGHELFINRVTIETQLGVYVYKPYAYESDLYQRLGMKYYFQKNLFAGLALKTHGGRAEAIEAGMGVRL